MLDEVVVTGYGMSQKRSLMTNSISKLDDKVLQNAAMSNAAQSLQGTVSGLRVTNTSGKPGSSPNIRIAWWCFHKQESGRSVGRGGWPCAFHG